MTSSKNKHSVDIYTKNDGNFTIESQKIKLFMKLQGCLWMMCLNGVGLLRGISRGGPWRGSLERVSGGGLTLLERAKFHYDLFVL